MHLEQKLNHREKKDTGLVRLKEKMYENSNNISKKTFESTLVNGIKNHNFATDKFYWIDGIVFCTYCDKRISKAEDMSQHSNGSKHKAKKSKNLLGLIKIQKIKHCELQCNKIPTPVLLMMKNCIVDQR